MATTAATPNSTATTEGRFSKTAAYYLAFVGLGLAVASLGPTLPGLAEQTRTMLSEISYLFTARSLGYLLGSFQGSRLYDRVPGHPVMAVMLLTIAAMLALVPLMSLLWLLTATLLILGTAEGTLDVGGNTLLVWVHRRKVGPYMNALHFFFGVGAFLSPLIIDQAVLRSGNITWAYWTLALIIAPVAVWLLRLPSPKPLTSSPDQAADQFERPPPEPLRTKLARLSNRVVWPTIQIFSQPARQRLRLKTSWQDSMAKLQQPGQLLVPLIATFFFFYAGAEVSFGGWIFTYAVALDLLTATTAAYLTSAFWGALTIGRLLAIPIAARFRPRAILLADLIGCLASLSIMILWPGSILAVWAGTIGIGLAMASVFPMTLTLAGRRMIITGRITGWFFVGASLGGMFLPLLIGQLFEVLGPQVTVLLVFVDMLMALGVFIVTIRYSARLKELT